MIAAYLWLNAILYLVFAVLCAANPRGTARSLGYGLATAGGMSEYVTVYGGLQLGLAAFFAWLAQRESLQPAGILFAVCLYAPIVLARWITVWRLWPVGRVTIAVGLLEAALLVLALWLWWRRSG